MAKKILVIGDALLDVEFHSSPSKLSAEAPAAVHRMHAGGVRYAPGGAANVAANLSALGVSTYLFSARADDADGDLLARCVEQAGLSTFWVIGRGETTRKNRVYSDGRQVVRFDQENGLRADDEASSQWSAIADLCQRGDIAAIVVSDYNKGLISPELAASILSLGIPVLVDARPATLPLYAGAYAFKINRREAIELAGDLLHPALLAGDPVDSAIYAAKHVAAKFRPGGFGVVTVDRHGCVVGAGPDWVSMPGGRVEISDSCGAGDTFQAALAFGVMHGFGSIVELASFAMAAAEVAVQRVGTATPSLAQVFARLQETGGPAAKVTSVQMAAAVAASHQLSGGRVAMAAGCFDGLHAGHVHLLQQAKAASTFLIVAVNDDHSLRRLKGEGRPLVPDLQRRLHLAELNCVDMVISFAGDPVAILRDIRPQIYVKGRDTTACAGADYMARIGGRVIFADTLDKFHSSCFAADLKSVASPLE